MEDFYSSEKQFFVRREEARRLRRKRGWGDLSFVPLKAPRQEELFGATSEEASEAKKEEKEEKKEREMKGDEMRL